MFLKGVDAKKKKKSQPFLGVELAEIRSFCRGRGDPRVKKRGSCWYPAGVAAGAELAPGSLHRAVEEPL